MAPWIDDELVDGPRCPECGSTNYIETVRVEVCEDCGYEAYYPSAH